MARRVELSTARWRTVGRLALQSYIRIATELRPNLNYVHKVRFIVFRPQHDDCMQPFLRWDIGNIQTICIALHRQAGELSVKNRRTWLASTAVAGETCRAANYFYSRKFTPDAP
jgi:hypothetical protein